jgi:hypothetical protein
LDSISHKIISGWKVIFKYPFRLLPKKNYFEKIQTEKLFEDIDCYLVRRSNFDAIKTFINNEVIEKALFKEDNEMPGLSMNLLGAKFKENHIIFNPKKIGSKPWTHFRSCFYLRELSELEIEIFNNSCPIFFKINDLNGYKISFERGTKELNDILKRKASSSGSKNNGKEILDGEVEVMHKPTNLNYWHIEFNFYTGYSINGEKNYMKRGNTDSIWANGVVQSLKDLLISSAISKVENQIKLIPEKYYMKK